jgi:hypothetical protein
MIVENPKEYKFIGFEVSKRKDKKYNAILQHKTSGRYKKVPFGDTAYQHYKDTTGLGAFSHLDHEDKERRRLYKLRHQKTKDNKFSSSFFAWHYLWA